MKTLKLKIKNGKKGYAILELLFYIAFFSALTLLVINSIIIMSKSFRETVTQAEFAQSGAIMERISREIRQARDVISISENGLVLNVGGDKITEFKFTGSNIELWDIGVNMGNLNSPSIIVTGLNFTQIDTANGKAVKVVLSVRSKNDSLARVADFYDTVVLRGNY